MLWCTQIKVKVSFEIVNKLKVYNEIEKRKKISLIVRDWIHRNSMSVPVLLFFPCTTAWKFTRRSKVGTASSTSAYRWRLRFWRVYITRPKWPDFDTFLVFLTEALRESNDETVRHEGASPVVHPVLIGKHDAMVKEGVIKEDPLQAYPDKL